MVIPVSAVSRMKREFPNAAALCTSAKMCGLKLRLTQAERFWRGNFNEIEGAESFLLMLGLRLVVKEIKK